MKKLLGTLLSPWLLVFVGLGAFAASIWWVGPLVAVGPYRPLDAETARWIVIGGVIGLYLVSKLLAAWRAWRTNRSVSKQLVAAPTDNPSTPETPEEKQLRERFDQALQLLRKARFAQDRRGLSTLSARVGKRYLYELPWYLIIGAPGSGKTTALLNAGLRFPLSATSGNKAGGGLAGVGGTRNCDWWFTDQAVLIDTAGRYTTQDSDAQGDKTAWQRLPRSAAAQPPAPADQRCAGHGVDTRPAAAIGGRTRAPDRRGARPRAGAAPALRRALPRLPAGHEDRPRLGFRRLPRRRRQGHARHTVGLHLRQGHAGEPAPCSLRHRIRPAGRSV